MRVNPANLRVCHAKQTFLKISKEYCSLSIVARCYFRIFLAIFIVVVAVNITILMFEHVYVSQSP